MTSIIESLKSNHLKDFTNKLERAIQSSNPETQKKFLELFEKYDKKFQDINENYELPDKKDIFERDFVKEVLNNSPFEDALISIDIFYSKLLLSSPDIKNTPEIKKHLESFMKSLQEITTTELKY